MDEEFKSKLSTDHLDRLKWFEDHAGQFSSAPRPLDGNRYLVSAPKGIFKPEGWSYALSIKIMHGSRYDDGQPIPTEAGGWQLSYHQEGEDPELYTNAALRRCIRDRVPIGVLRKANARRRPSLYEVMGLALPVRWQDGYFIMEGLTPYGVPNDDSAETIPPQALVAATLDEALRALQGLRPQEADGLPKRHQPLALLWAVGRARQEHDPLTPWPVARTQIGDLIEAFGRPTDRPNAYLPFLALARTDLWELTAEPPKGQGSDARREWLTNTTPPIKGGLSQRFCNLLATGTDAAAAIVANLLDTYFDDADTDSLLEAAGLSDLAGNIHGLNEQHAAQALIRALASDSTVIAAEASNVESTQYERTPGTVTVRRGEAQLVARYLQTLPQDKATRLQLAVGLTDLYDEETAEIIEAKVSAEHRYIRQALGQLLDYAANCHQPLNRLTALFPAPPAAPDIQLLHLYGIDCLLWAGGTTFHRLEAPTVARARIHEAWSQRA